MLWSRDHRTPMIPESLKLTRSNDVIDTDKRYYAIHWSLPGQIVRQNILPFSTSRCRSFISISNRIK